jgi:hypothetical protein
MLGAAGRVQAARGLSSGGGDAVRYVALSRRVVVMVVLVGMAGGAAVFGGLAAERSGTNLAPSAGFARHGGLLSLPAAAQGPISRSLGSDGAAYRVRTAGTAFQATSPTQRLHLRFDRSGVEIGSGRLKLGLGLRAIGFAGSLSTVGGTIPRVNANRVSYTRAGLTEWYANGPLGLEQGFTLSRAPSPRVSGPLTLSVGALRNAHAVLAADRRSVTFSHSGASLRYTALSVIDARGHTLHSWLQLMRGRLLLRVDAREARYPLRIDPLIQQGGARSAAVETAQGEFGFSVALSRDGSTALVGGPLDNEGVGSAWVFTRSGSSWNEQAKLTQTENTKAIGFGHDVALSENGDIALIGAQQPNGFVANAAWVFVRSGSTWSQQQKLTGTGDFGFSVALSGDGKTALIGAIEANAGTGSASAFTRSGSTWTEQEKFKPSSTGSPSDFGHSLALSNDGDTALIGGGISEDGQAWVFTRSGSIWTQQEKLTGTNEVIGDEIFTGPSVALSEDGNTALVGKYADSGFNGAAWMFTRSGGNWTQQGEKLTGAAKSQFGTAVAVSGDGNTALIGAPHDGGGDFGYTWEFARSGGTWTPQGPKFTFNGASPSDSEWFFGGAVALSEEGDIALIGGPGGGFRAGRVWFFASGSPAAPAVATGAASAITASSATLNATVNPNGTEVSDCHFEYGTTTDYGSSAPCATTPGWGTAPVAVAAQAAGLASKTLYHFRIVATNAGGTSYGGDATFTTALSSQEEAGARRRAEEEAAAKRKAEEEAAARRKAEAEAAAKRKAEEEAAARRKHEEELRKTCGISVGHPTIKVVRGEAAITLIGAGTTTCGGRVTLVAKSPHRNGSAKNVGTASFSILAGTRQTVRLRLTAAGRAFLSAAHGHLNATLAILKSSPSPASTETHRVYLVRAKR